MLACKKWLPIFFVLCMQQLCGANLNLPPKVVVQIPAAHQDETIRGEITITHLAGQKVDEASFTLEGKPLKVTSIGDTYPTGKAKVETETLVVSKYSFELAGRPRGLYLLPQIHLKAGDDLVASPQITFEVVAAQISEELLLDARVVEKPPFYPGQKVTFQYLISFRNPIQLTKEKLPLLEYPGFRTVGAPKIDNVPQGSNTVQVISQQAIAQEPGTYHSGVSSIEGYIYGEDALGNKIYSPTLIKAQAPDVQITVLAFPKEGQPVSFNGAIGVFYWRVKAISATSVAVGEKITLEVLVTGSGDFDTVNMPDLSKQKGFKDLFRLSDLAPIGETKEAYKKFTLELRPISTAAKVIPAIEFSSFDPISKTYVVKSSDPISITVRPGSKIEQPQPNLEGMPPPVWPIEIQGNVILEERDQQSTHMQDILLLYAAVLLAAALGAQQMFRKLYEASKKKIAHSRDLFLEAIKQKANPDVCCKLIREALLLRLFEVGQTTQLESVPEELSTEGLQGEIRGLLISIEKKRFMGLETQVEVNEIINEASQLYYRLK